MSYDDASLYDEVKEMYAAEARSPKYTLSDKEAYKLGIAAKVYSDHLLWNRGQKISTADMSGGEIKFFANMNYDIALKMR